MHYASKSRWVTSMILRYKLVDSISIAVSPAYLPFAFRTAPSVIIIGTFLWQPALDCALAGNLAILISIHGGTRIAGMLGGTGARFLTILITISGCSRSG